MAPYRTQLTGFLTLLSLGLSQPGGAEMLTPDEAESSAATGQYASDELSLAREQLALSDETLSDIRGGFSTGDGLQVAFGIERAVFVNGNLVTTTSINLPDVGKLISNKSQPDLMNGGSLPQTGDAAVKTNTIPNITDSGVNAINAGGLALVQNGAGNTFQPGAVAGNNLGTVIQNTLDNQKLQNVTMIQATVNSMGLFKSLDLQNTVRNAVNSSLLR